MSTITFDTHQFVTTLQAAGFEQPQAEARYSRTHQGKRK